MRTSSRGCGGRRTSSLGTCSRSRARRASTHEMRASRRWSGGFGRAGRSMSRRADDDAEQLLRPHVTERPDPRSFDPGRCPPGLPERYLRRTQETEYVPSPPARPHAIARRLVYERPRAGPPRDPPASSWSGRALSWLTGSPRGESRATGARPAADAAARWRGRARARVFRGSGPARRKKTAGDPAGRWAARALRGGGAAGVIAGARFGREGVARAPSRGADAALLERLASAWVRRDAAP